MENTCACHKIAMNGAFMTAVQLASRQTRLIVDVPRWHRAGNQGNAALPTLQQRSEKSVSYGSVHVL